MAALTAAPATATPDKALGTVDAGFSAEARLLPGLPAAAGRLTRSCAEASPVAPWILDTGADYGLCPSSTHGVRTKRDDLGTFMTASGPAIADHTITVNIDALQ